MIVVADVTKVAQLPPMACNEGAIPTYFPIFVSKPETSVNSSKRLIYVANPSGTEFYVPATLTLLSHDDRLTAKLAKVAVSASVPGKYGSPSNDGGYLMTATPLTIPPGTYSVSITIQLMACSATHDIPLGEITIGAI